MTEKPDETKTPEILATSDDIAKWDERHPAKTHERRSDSALILAIEKGLAPELIGKMMDLQERAEQREAKKLYVAAMAKWSVSAPDITKDKHVRFTTSKGTTEYNHATLGNVATAISKSMGPFGLKPNWITEQPEGKVKVTCTITHAGGHSESTSLIAGTDQSGSKNSIQALGSTISYLERYTLLALAGLATSDMDDDGQSSEKPTEYISKDQIKNITAGHGNVLDILWHRYL
jgi:hypothetical protein